MEGEKESSTSPKDKEKLKQRLQTLFKQEELKTKPKKTSKSVQAESNIGSQKPQQVNGKPAGISQTQTKSKDSQNLEQTYMNNKHMKKINRQLNKNVEQTIETPKPQKQQNTTQQEIPPSNNNRKNKKKRKMNEPEIGAASKNSQQNFQINAKKNKKFNQKHAAINTNENSSQSANAKTEIPTMVNVQKKLSKNQKKKARKIAVAMGMSPNQNNDSKKTELLQEASQQSQPNQKVKKNKKQKKNKAKNEFPKQHEEKQKTNDSKIYGLVNGGDFDNLSNEEDQYWAEQYNGNTQNSERDKTQFGGNEYEYDDPYDYSDLSEKETGNDSNMYKDGDDPYDYSDFSFEKQSEEEENYSDFDEDYRDFSSNFSESSDESNDDSHDFNDLDLGSEEDDVEYKPPDHILENLIIHSGTATKRDLLPEDNVQFKDKKRIQIIELQDQQEVKVIRQPYEYLREELLKLTFKEIPNRKMSEAQMQTEEITSDEEECPKLVRIDVDEDDFQLYHPNELQVEEEEEDDEGSYGDSVYSMYDDQDMESLGSIYSEVNSDDEGSFLSQDINAKYLNRTNSDDMNSDEEIDFLLAKNQKPDIIDATKCDYKDCLNKDCDGDDKENMESEDLPSYTLSRFVKVGSKANVITIPIVDKKYLKENHETEEVIVTSANEPKSDFSTLEDVEIFDSNHSDLNVVHMNTWETLQTTSADIAEDSKQSSFDNYDSDEKIINMNGLQSLQVNSPVSVEDIKHSKHTTNRLKKMTPKLNDYNTIFCNGITDNLVVILIKSPFYLYGTVRLTLLAGAVEVYGHCLAKNTEVELFSPRGCCEIEIASKQTLATDSISQEKLKEILNSYACHFLENDLELISNSFEPQKDAVVLLKRNEQRKKVVSQFKKFMNENVFPNIQNITMDRPLYDSENLLRCMINISATEHKCLRLPEEWKRLDVKSQSCVMLVGGKCVGKSTLLRFLINKHIARYDRVLLIDLDIGQPEIFVPQTVSCTIVDKPLLGPGFFLNMQPNKAFAVGNTNIVLCPHKYVAAVRCLIKHCMAQKEFENIPWFVNTMGYNKGFGPELISVIASVLPLTDVIQLQSNKAINNFDSLLFPAVVAKIPRHMFVDDNEIPTEAAKELKYNLHIWQSPVMQESRYQKEWYMSPKDMRYAILLTRLSACLQGHAEWLSECVPLSAPLDKLKFFNLADSTCQPSTEVLIKAMEANLVYMCHYENDIHSMECLGIGVVNAIDYHVQQLFIIPAISSSFYMNKVNCLALGEMILPSSLLINQGPFVQNTVPFVYNTVEAKASKAIKQIYHRNPKFLKGKHRALE